MVLMIMGSTGPEVLLRLATLPSIEVMSHPGDLFSRDSRALIAARHSLVIFAVDFFCSPSSHSMSWRRLLPR